MIDRDFMRSAAIEGFRLTAYVPPAGQSGVSIATGIDLGQMSRSDIDNLPLPAVLRSALRPYAGCRGSFAARVLTSAPLSLSQSEADALDDAVITRSVAKLRNQYNAAIGAEIASDTRFTWDELSDVQQTVIFSVAWQYGDLPSRCPRFWSFAKAQDWPRLIAELEDFKDAYPTRRKAEAAYLRASLTA